ncbi:DUF3889 domain-containing protein [Sporosarcina sp. FSL K6-3508]|uniref:DUF3889 domain-containing protein n=2 Tax=Caryophanaceae TaxID=186818 RepID=A0A1T4YP59_9BACL|nr:Protein of unknown function [Sporosarcina newyorkensis]
MTHPILKEVCVIIRKISLVIGISMASVSMFTYLPTELVAQSAIPSYAKWSRIAIQETQMKYPHANIMDYLHIGSESRKESTVEKFRLWLREGDKEFAVFVKVTYSIKTNKLIDIELQEMDFS